MIKEEEIAWYRHNVINKYVDEVMQYFSYPEIPEGSCTRVYPQKIPNNELEFRKCKRCGQVKSVNEFYLNPTINKGYCKMCSILTQKMNKKK